MRLEDAMSIGLALLIVALAVLLGRAPTKEWLRAVRALRWQEWLLALALLVVPLLALVVFALFVLWVGLLVAWFSVLATLAVIFLWNVAREHLAARRAVDARRIAHLRR